MKPEQEPKYEARDGRIYNRASGEAIPDDEPVFIFRARDKMAIKALEGYLQALAATEPKNYQHIQAVCERIVHFSDFKTNNFHRMKMPDTGATK